MIWDYRPRCKIERNESSEASSIEQLLQIGLDDFHHYPLEFLIDEYPFLPKVSIHV
jgi:hypothetical protein